ncbi:helix-turn-helix domain-containing protein [Thermoflavimicrobium daqui]|nr:tetratricopeptide repeat protein [Thermoflavimicrobium daqui]
MYKRIGRVLRQKRKASGKILEDFANDDISTSTISNIERGSTKVSWEKVVIYAKELGITEDELPSLLEGEQDQQQRLLNQLLNLERRIDLEGPDQVLKKINRLNIPSISPLMANVEYLKGRCYLKKKNWGKARLHFHQVLNIIKRYPDFHKTNLKAACHKDLARTYYFQENDLVKALDHVNLGLRSLITKSESQTEYSLLIGKISYLINLDQETETAKKTVDKLWDERDKIYSIDAKISLHENRAALLNKMELYEEARESASEGISLALKNNILDRAVELLNTYGSICINEQDFDQAEEYFLLALDTKPKIQKKYQKEYLLVTTLTLLGKLYKAQGHTTKAEKALLEAVELGKKTKSQEVLRYHDALVALGDCYFSKNKLRKAIAPYSQALEIAKIQSQAHKKFFWVEKEHELWVKLGMCYEKFDSEKLKLCMERSFRFNVEYIKRGGGEYMDKQFSSKILLHIGEPPDNRSTSLEGEPPDNLI